VVVVEWELAQVRPPGGGQRGVNSPALICPPPGGLTSWRLPTTEQHFIQHLLAGFPVATADRTTTNPANARLIEPLTAREIEVLHLLAEQLTNREIGERLFIGEDTVKKHASHLFGKLGVATRRDAVRQAQQLGILYLIKH